MASERNVVIWTNSDPAATLETLNLPVYWNFKAVLVDYSASDQFFKSPKQVRATVTPETDFLILAPIAMYKHGHSQLIKFRKSWVNLLLSSHRQCVLIGADSLEHPYPHKRIKPCGINLYNCAAFTSPNESTLSKVKQFQGVLGPPNAEFWAQVEQLREKRN